MEHGAYSLISIKAINDETRTFSGTATTPTPDRGNDVIEPLGVEFDNPIPLLFHHDRERPVGLVTLHTPTAEGIDFTASIPVILEAGALKTRVDEAWQSVKAGLIRAVSVCVTARKEHVQPRPGGGIHWLKSQIHELSLVTIPMNRQATIHTVKEFDTPLIAGTTTPHSAGTLPIVRAEKAAPTMSTVQEQITNFTNTRAAKVAEMNTLMTAAADKGETLDAPNTEKYDGLASEVKAIDAHLPRLRDLEKANIVAAVPVTGVINTVTASEVRGGVSVVSVKANVPKGTAFARYALAKMIGAITMSDPVRVAEGRKDWTDQTPEVLLALKTAVNPGTVAEPAWAAPLAVTRPMAEEFLELLRPKTLIGRITGLRKVPFNISMPVQTGGGTYRWVGEGAPKPVGNLQLTSAALGIAKAAGIIVFSQELAKLSSPNVETVVSADMVKGMAQYLDQQFIDPTVAAVANVSPASITNGAVSIGSAGTSGANAETDFKGLVSSLIAVNQSLENVTLIMSETNALALSMARTTNGEPYFPNLTMNGGNIGGIPVLTSQAAGTTVAMIVPNEILFADEGGVDIDVSREASLEMDTAPTSPTAAGTVLVSLWQLNLIGMKAERWINYKRARLAAVRYTTATYV